MTLYTKIIFCTVFVETHNSKAYKRLAAMSPKKRKGLLRKFLTVILIVIGTSAFAQSNYYAKQAASYTSEAQYYINKADGYDREAKYYNDKAVSYLREVEYYLRNGDYDRAASNAKWASDAADQAMTQAKYANNARDKARDQLRYARDAMDKAKR